MVRRPLLLTALVLFGCSGDGPTRSELDHPVNLEGSFQLQTLDGIALPVSFPYRPCPFSEVPREGLVVAATLTLEDVATNPSLPDPVRLEWVESRTGCRGADRDTLRLMAWGTVVAYQDSLVLSWYDDSWVAGSAEREGAGVILLEVSRRDQAHLGSFRQGAGP